MEDLQKMIRLADKGDLGAMVEVAGYILWDDESTPVDSELLDRALGYLNKAIEKGSDAAMLSLGAVYYCGRGVGRNYAKAIELYTRAANLGNSVAMNNLGYCYYYGRDIPVNMEKAYQMFSKAAMLGDPQALYKCGDMYMWGKYVEADQKTAYRLYCDAYGMLEGDKPMEFYPDICMRIGSCLHRGRGTEKDLERAEEFLREAKLYFKKKFDGGDRLSAPGGLKSSTEEWIEVSRELEAEKKR